jgi:uncharacterized protein
MNSRLRMQVYRTTHLLHWISAAVCFAALLLFTITGITLNHASSIGASPRVTKHAAQAPETVRLALRGSEKPDALDPAIAKWLEAEFQMDVARASVEWSQDELYVSAPGPGRDAWVSIDRAGGAAKSEVTDRGWIAFFNDLHKGRNTGVTWTIFIDVIAAACLFFSLTGLILLQIQARQRKSTWPLVFGGAALVLAVMIFFAH